MRALAAYAYIFLLQVFVKPVTIATSAVLASAIWAIVGSFMWDGYQEPIGVMVHSSWETVGAFAQRLQLRLQSRVSWLFDELLPVCR